MREQEVVDTNQRWFGKMVKVKIADADKMRKTNWTVLGSKRSGQAIKSRVVRRIPNGNQMSTMLRYNDYRRTHSLKGKCRDVGQ